MRLWTDLPNRLCVLPKSTQTLFSCCDVTSLREGAAEFDLGGIILSSEAPHENRMKAEPR